MSDVNGLIEMAVLLPTEIMGGHEKMLFEWLTRARELGLYPTIHGRAGWQLEDRARELGFAWKDAGYGIDRRDALRLVQWRNFVRTFRIVRDLPRDTPVLLAPGGMQFGLVHVLACVLARRNVVYYVPMAYGASLMRLRWPALRDWLAGLAARRVAMWITVSNEQKRRLERLWRVRAPVYVIPNRLRVLEESPCRGRRARDVGSELRLLYAGRFDEVQKGLDWFAATLLARYEWMDNIFVTFQGSGPFASHLENLRQQLGTNRVRVLPWGSLSESFAASDVLILPSRFEGLPLVAIEAIWAGIPVAATRASGLEDILPEECLFSAADLDTFRRTLEHLRSSERRELAVTQARERLEQLLRADKFAMAIREVVGGLSDVAARVVDSRSARRGAGSGAG